jgi:hypothetical protein
MLHLGVAYFLKPRGIPPGLQVGSFGRFDSFDHFDRHLV